MNNLYVAVSRAREQLWIIETEEGWESFWAQLSQWLKRPDIALASSQEGYEVGFSWSPGVMGELVKASNRRWPSLAEEFERLAHDQESPDHAERSAYYYDRLGRVNDRNRMLAWATYYQGFTLQAAERMWDIDNAQASDWFWQAAADNHQAWQEMADRSELQPPWRRQLAELYRRIRAGSCNAECFAEIVGLLEELHQRGQVRGDRNTSFWPTWEHLLLGTFRAISRAAGLSEGMRRSAYQLANDLAPQGALARNYEN